MDSAGRLECLTDLNVVVMQQCFVQQLTSGDDDDDGMYTKEWCEGDSFYVKATVEVNQNITPFYALSN